MKNPRALGALAVLLAAAAVACGEGEPADLGSSTTDAVDITMTDNAFSREALTMSVGEEVTFRFRNDGSVVHEALIGPADVQAAHAVEMDDAPAGHGDGHDGDRPDAMEGMDHGGGEGTVLSLDPGETGEVTYTFDEPGEVEIGCHEPGHYEDGMRATITVE
jgi:uncharacterized cupredoxin-like copper-binding protein